MSLLALKAYFELIRFERYLAPGRFAALRAKVRICPVAAQTPPANHAIEPICSAMDTACIWYWKEVLCLQRSAATTCLLKRCGVAAEMVIGARPTPFKAHAWVEVGGRIVNDKPYIGEIYPVLDRC